MSRVSGVTELIRVMLLRGDVPAGGRLVELHLVERLRVARPTVRLALRRLEGDGLLVADPSGGMRVVRLDDGEVADALEVRAALEGLAAGLAARRVRSGDLGRAAVRELGALADAADDRAFHRAAAALGANRACQEALGRLWDRLLVSGWAAAADGHHELLDALATGDEDHAADAARRHVLRR